LKSVEAAARKLAESEPSLVDAERLPLPKGYVQSSVHILKARPQKP
jgi:hypothetical protein